MFNGNNGVFQIAAIFDCSRSFVHPSESASEPSLNPDMLRGSPETMTEDAQLEIPDMSDFKNLRWLQQVDKLSQLLSVHPRLQEQEETQKPYLRLSTSQKETIIVEGHLNLTLLKLRRVQSDISFAAKCLRKERAPWRLEDARLRPLLVRAKEINCPENVFELLHLRKSLGHIAERRRILNHQDI